MPPQDAAVSRRNVCDHCRRRRIRCDGAAPCHQCISAALTCKREHVPKKRGPKKGTGRVINELRAQDEHEWVDPSTPPCLLDLTPPPDFLSLVPTCVELFFEHLSPIMPVLYMPTVQATMHPSSPHDKNLIYALCGVTCTHMSGKSLPTPQLSVTWELLGRCFLNECLQIRRTYDFVEDMQLSAVISSYFVSIAFFELNMSRKSWYYLREALTIAQDLGLQHEATYKTLDTIEALCRRRTFWLLYITERSFAIFRHKPLSLFTTPMLPSATDTHPYETPPVLAGFIHLVHIYSLLDDAFVSAWNEAADTAPVSLQESLNKLNQHHQFADPNFALTDTQKADILVTQQWLRLVTWQSSMRQGLVSFTSADPSLTFRYPVQIAYTLLQAVSTLPATSIEVHGMGIFEKIFEIGCSMLDVVQAFGLGVDALHARVSRDPFSTFIQILSGNPNSQKLYANLLMAKASEKPEIQRFNLQAPPALLEAEEWLEDLNGSDPTP